MVTLQVLVLVGCGVQVSRKEFHTYICLDYSKIEFLSYIKNKIKII